MIKGFELPQEKTFTGSARRADRLTEFSLFYGANGTGKSTIANALGSSSPHIDWENDRPLEIRIYNREFVEANFGADIIPGVFTLGQDQKLHLEQIETLQVLLEGLEVRKNDINGKIRVNQELIKERRSELKNSCWVVLKDLTTHPVLEEALTGFLASKDKFLDRIFSTEDLPQKGQTREALIKDGESLFRNTGKVLYVPGMVTFQTALDVEADSIWTRPLLSSGSLPIMKLAGNPLYQDWVRQGIGYLKESEDNCPMCNRLLSEENLTALEKMFDAVYEQEVAYISQKVVLYEGAVQSVNEEVGRTLEFLSELDICGQLEATHNRWKLVVNKNIYELTAKATNPGAIAAVVSSQAESIELIHLLEQVRSLCQAVNRRLEDEKREKEKFKKELWAFIRSTLLGSKVDAYLDFQKDCLAEVSTLKDLLDQTQLEIERVQSDLSKLVSLSGGMQPTVDAINRELRSFGFEGFSLRLSSKSGYMELVRPSGEPCHYTLSEGERNLVTYLYFVHLLQGGHAGSNLSSPIVAVIDDPVSSMDVDVMHMIADSILDLVGASLRAVSRVRQVIVLTHNPFFYKELCEIQGYGLRVQCLSHFVVSKNFGTSVIERLSAKPIIDDYTHLWRIAMKCDDMMLLPNALRRIMEYCCRFVGSEKVRGSFKELQGDDARVARSLLRVTHSGSHAVGDDIHFNFGSVSAAQCRLVFRRLFDIWKLADHYELMVKAVEEAYGVGEIAT